MVDCVFAALQTRTAPALAAIRAVLQMTLNLLLRPSLPLLKMQDLEKDPSGSKGFCI